MTSRILLINPWTITDAKTPLRRTGQPYIPYGLLCIASVLEEAGHEVTIYDRNADLRSIAAVVNKYWPDMIGVSAMTGPCLLDALSISEQAKIIKPDIHVVWGGVHPTLLPTQTLQESCIDFVVRGEGEYTLLDLVDTLERNRDPSQVKGISYKKGTEVCHTPSRPFIQPLDELPPPAWHLLDIGKYKSKLNTSRGCPYKCKFCYNVEFNKRYWRGLSARKVVEYIHFLQSQYDFKFIEFAEDNFTVNQKRLREICELLIKEKVDLEWACESRVGSLDRDLLLKMKKSECAWIAFGIESGSPRILKFIGKDITISQVVQTFRLCAQVGIYADAYAMCGLPTETVREFNMTLKLLRKLPYRFCDLMVYRPYPGTELYDFCINQGIFTPPSRLKDWAAISDQHSPRFSVGQIPEDMLWDAIILIERQNIKKENRRIPFTFLEFTRKILNARAIWRELPFHIIRAYKHARR